MGDLPPDESCDGPVVVLLALKIDPQPSGLLPPLGVPGIPLDALASIRDSQYAMRTAAEFLSFAFAGKAHLATAYSQGRSAGTQSPEPRHNLPGLPTYTEIRSTRLRETSLPRRS